jgi:hypothetical protein
MKKETFLKVIKLHQEQEESILKYLNEHAAEIFII